MPKSIEWKSMQPLQEGWNGCLGDERMWAVIPWAEESTGWPSQLQTFRPEFMEQEAVLTARTRASTSET